MCNCNSGYIGDEDFDSFVEEGYDPTVSYVGDEDYMESLFGGKKGKAKRKAKRATRKAKRAAKGGGLFKKAVKGVKKLHENSIKGLVAPHLLVKDALKKKKRAAAPAELEEETVAPTPTMGIVGAPNSSIAEQAAAAEESIDINPSGQQTGWGEEEMALSEQIEQDGGYDFEASDEAEYEEEGFFGKEMKKSQKVLIISIAVVIAVIIAVVVITKKLKKK